MKSGNDILVVDDDVDMVEVIELVLQDAGYPTRTALNGRQALAAVAQGLPALIVLDMLMPVMNGWEFAREFRALYGPEIPIVVATAAEHVRSRGDAIDAAGVLPKPFEVSDLLRLVSRYVPTQRDETTPPP
ncbi:MAG TPA: response regulator [Polyangia bacterium]|nr:response regulator [Polyangia bacterium]